MPGELAEFPPVQGRHQVLILRIIDGDTVRYAILLVQTGRIRGIDAPELKTEAGKRSREALGRMITPGRLATAHLYGRDKYGRVLVDFIGEDNFWVSLLLVNGGHAKPWSGEGPKPK